MAQHDALAVVEALRDTRGHRVERRAGPKLR